MIQFEKVSLTDLIVIISLSLGFILAIFYGERELAMSLASGLFGYVGGSVAKSHVSKNKEGAENG
ncbi:MAG: hypothetical protein K6C05_02470 [Anaerovibrio sp.]|uniref:hypothetical protein n=1 Tax=Anaerovibrio sp. TaxID=1872532 RepID=UPI0025FD68F7|nr:hypothetical protein [Anaerovibrio sp.]MCR5175694.1 hypothetical protein [Anaerovibrio sp.]